MTGKWIEVFRTGDYGDKGSYTEADIDQIIANFNETDKVPIVVGHPSTDSPAWGWVDALKRKGDTLFARVAEMRDELQQAIADGRFRNRSIKLIHRDTGPALAHIGFLGGVLPEVKGLASLPAFAAGDGVEFEFGISVSDAGDAIRQELDSLRQELDSLKQQLSDETVRRVAAESELEQLKAQTRRQEFEAWVQEQVQQGRIPVSLKDALISLLTSLPAAGEVSFSRVSAVDLVKTIISTLPAPTFSQELPPPAPHQAKQPVDLTKYL